MSTNLTINGITYAFPQLSDQGWAENVTNWATAVTQGMLQKAGGSFTLTADVDFGANFGLKSAYYSSRSANVASAGQIRLSNSDTIKFRNSTNATNLPFGAGSFDDVPSWNSLDLVNVSSAQTLTNKTLTSPTINGGTLSSVTLSSPTFTGTLAGVNLTLTGNTILGDASGDTVTFNATPTFLTQALFPGGSVGAPSVTLGNATCGLYSPSANTLRVATAGSDVAEFASGQFRLQNGNAGSPSIVGVNFNTTGWYWAAGPKLSASVGTQAILTMTTTGAQMDSGVFLFSAGSVGSPSISLLNDTNTGYFSNGADNISATAGGSLIWQTDTTGFTLSSSKQMFMPNGTSTTPPFSFNSEGTLGFGRDASGSVSLFSSDATRGRFFLNAITANAEASIILNSASGTGDQLIGFGEGSSDTGAWSIGRDDSDSSKFKISQKLGVLGTNDYLSITTTGNVVLGKAAAQMGFFGATAVSQQTYSVSNVTTDRTYDANSTSLDEIADALGTLVADLRSLGLVL